MIYLCLCFCGFSGIVSISGALTRGVPGFQQLSYEWILATKSNLTEILTFALDKIHLLYHYLSRVILLDKAKNQWKHLTEYVRWHGGSEEVRIETKCSNCITHATDTEHLWACSDGITGQVVAMKKI